MGHQYLRGARGEGGHTQGHRVNFFKASESVLTKGLLNVLLCELTNILLRSKRLHEFRTLFCFLFARYNFFYVFIAGFLLV